MGAEQNDLPLDADVAELNREAQRAVDRVIAARVELDASIKDLLAKRDTIAGGSAAAVAFIDSYMNPVAAPPPPVAPDVAAPPPAVEPPVFTTVDTAELTPETTSGGTAPVIDDVFDVPEQPAGEGTGSTDGAVGTLGE